MHKDLEKRLVEDFPDLYCRHLEPAESYPFHFECGSGWEPLLRRLSERITRITQSLPLGSPTPVGHSSISDETTAEAGRYAGLTRRSFCAVQVKEKYGGLRFYMSRSTSEMGQAIDDAEEESVRTCETCGRPGTLRGKTWYFVACDEHNSEEVVGLPS